MQYLRRSHLPRSLDSIKKQKNDITAPLQSRGWCSRQLAIPYYLSKHLRTAGGGIYNSGERVSPQQPVARDQNVLFLAAFHNQESAS